MENTALSFESNFTVRPLAQGRLAVRAISDTGYRYLRSIDRLPGQVVSVTEEQLGVFVTYFQQFQIEIVLGD